jgi:hypothetical protein
MAVEISRRQEQQEEGGTTDWGLGGGWREGVEMRVSGHWVGRSSKYRAGVGQKQQQE